MTRVREMSTSLCGDFSDFEAIVIRKSPVREEVHRASIPADNAGGGASPAAGNRWEEECGSDIYNLCCIAQVIKARPALICRVRQRLGRGRLRAR